MSRTYRRSGYVPKWFDEDFHDAYKYYGDHNKFRCTGANRLLKETTNKAIRSKQREEIHRIKNNLTDEVIDMRKYYKLLRWVYY